MAGFLPGLGSFLDIFTDSIGQKSKELELKADQARADLAVKAQGMTRAANINAVSIWSQGVSGSITDQAQYGIDQTASQIANERRMLEQQIELQHDMLTSARVKQIFGFMTDIAGAALGTYSANSDTIAAFNLNKPTASDYGGNANNPLFQKAYSSWEDKKNRQLMKNIIFG